VNHEFVTCNEEICDKVSNVYAGVTTIARGKSMRSGDMDDPSDDARMFTNAEICYSSSSCSLLVIDRENQAMLEIQLQPDGLISG
jgi:hypothetical protein